MNRYFYWLGNLCIVLYSKLLRLFGYDTYPVRNIPTGPYCYEPDIQRNENKEDPWAYHTISCPYYKTLGRKWNGCSYLGTITDDMLFADQCKLCGERTEEENNVKTVN